MPDRVIGPDGIERTAEEQKRLNEVCAIGISGARGRVFMDYLRSISIERASGPHISDQELRHLEGMRYLVAIISQRAAAHNREKQRGKQ